ncbi:MAG: Abi family protein [Clostridia bacterium]|nr:Abi family protein [Clostridia bacterium]
MAKRKTYATVKPARSFEEQAQRLTELHGLDVGNADRARHLFSTVNYYRLTTYGNHLRRADDPERFADGVTLDMLYDLYQFDMGMRHQILPVLEFFEVQLRAKLSYHLAMTYGSLGYMQADNFRAERLPNGSLVHGNLIGKFKSEVKRSGDLAFVRHHKQKYGGQFPIWAAVELFTFGMLGSLFDIMQEKDQYAVSRQYDLEPYQLSRLIAVATDVRNICAHYNRLYNQPLEQKPILPDKYRKYEKNTLFALLLGLRAVAGNQRVYHQMIRGIRDLTEDYPCAELALCGFPENWEDLLREG